jgi:hypothetical protein
MTPQDKAIEPDRRRKMDDAFGRAVERAKNSPDGMRLTAKGLRERARNISAAGDRAAMLRIASECERRAMELDLLKARAAK